MSIEAVAARAGVGKTSIYRRWTSKDELVIDALHEVQVNLWFVDTGNFQKCLPELNESSLSRSTVSQAHQ